MTPSPEMKMYPSILRAISHTFRRHRVPDDGHRRSSATRLSTSPMRLLALATIASVIATMLAGSLPAAADTTITFGSVAGGYDTAVRESGEQLGKHSYSSFDKTPPTARMITVHAGNATFRQVANVQAGSTLHNNIVRWARTIKSRGAPVMLAYNHEPEAAGERRGTGTSAEFIAAWRRVVTIFRDQGVTNVEWTWQMTAWSFKAPSKDLRAAARWYPGNAYVDNIGADAYNWYTCGHGRGKWNQLEALGDPVLDFARARGKKASFPEFASHRGSSRAAWLRTAGQYLEDNKDVVTAAFYFNRPPTVSSNSDCRWALSTAGEWDAFGDVARGSSFGP